MKTHFRKLNILVSALLFLAMLLGLAMPLSGAQAIGTTVLVDNLQPSWTALGGGGVFSAYVGPTAYGYVSPGSTALYDGREAGIIKAGLNIDLTDLVYEDEGLFGFIPNVTIDAFAAGTLTYDVETQAGVNPVWMTIEIDTGVVGVRTDNTTYQFVPTTNPAGWHTVDAAAGLWQQWTTYISGVTTGSPMTLSAVATANTGLNVVRAYLRLGQGNSYFNGGTGTIAWVDKATLGGVTYDFILAKYWYVAKTGLDTNEGTLASPFLTISHAIDAAAPTGDTIYVAAGTYNEVVTVNKSLILNGAQAGVDARGRTGSETIIPAQSGGTGNSAISITANNVTIDGFTIQGAGTATLQTWGINAAAGTATSYVHITNNIFQNLFEGLHVQGPNTNVSSHMTVDKNSFFDDPSDVFAKDAGIWMASAPSDNLTITNNSFSGHDGCDGGNYAAINIDFSTDLVITNNTGHNDGSFLVLVNDTNVTVSGNSMVNSSTPPCYMQSSAIFLGLGNNGVIIQNNTLDHGYRGVRLSTAFGTGLNQNIQVLKNTITNMVDAGILVPVGTVSDPVIVHDNQIIGNLIGIQNDNTTPIVNATNNWWGDASGPGTVGPGTGDHVSLNVNFTPWCVNEACTSDQPPLPSSFWGHIYFQTGDNPPNSSSLLTAWIPGVTGAAASVTLTVPTQYAFNVPGDLPGTTTKEGGVENDDITFKIDGRIVATGVWHGGTNVQLDLHPPQAVPGGPYYGLVGVSISLNGSANDWGPAPTNYAWDLDNNGSYETSGQNITHVWNTVGTYTIGLQVTDSQGGVGTATTTVYVQTTCTVTNLIAGWNLVSLCLAPVNTTPGTVLNSLSGSYDLVYGWDGSVASNNWLKFAPGGPGYANNMTRLDEKMGFWVHMTSGPGTLTVTGFPPVSTSIPLSTVGGGWNLVGYPSLTAMNLPGTSLHDFTLIYAYHAADTADPWKLFDVSAPQSWVSDLQSLTATWGYWIYVTSTYSWTVTY